MSEHPAHLAARTALARLRTAWDYLADSLEPGPTSRGEHALTPGRRAALDRLTRAERVDRHATQAAGHTPSGPHPAPLRVAVLDAQVFAVLAAADAAWMAASAIRTRGWPFTYHPAWADDTERFSAACDYLAVTVPRLDVPLVEEIGDDLSTADRVARAIAGVGSDERPVKAECPACEHRSLVADVGPANPADWTIRCTWTTCRCRGVDCGCNRPVRWPGRRHQWPRREFDQLARLLDREETS